MNKKIKIMLIAVAAVLSGLFVVGAVAGSNDIDSMVDEVKAAEDSSSAPEPEETETAETTPDLPESEPHYVTPVDRNFTVDLVTVERQKFGSAGDLVTWESDIAVDFSGDLDPSKTYRLTFDVNGGEDGAETYSVEISGDAYQVESGMTSVPGGGELTAEVTDLTELNR